MKSFLIAFLLTLTPTTLPAAQSFRVPGPLVDSAWLADHLNRVVILDVRKDTKSFYTKTVSKTAKANGHIPGAVLVDWKKARANRVINGTKLKGMLPTKDAFEQLMRASSVNRDSAIIIVSKGEKSRDVTYATRLYWTLKYFDHDNVALLDGGTAKWILDKREVAYDQTKVSPGNFVATAERRELLATAEDVQKAVRSRGATLVVDTRSLEYYLGAVKKPYVSAKGHIPGAKVFPHTLLVNHGPATFRKPTELKQLAQSLGIDPHQPQITYCNSGALSSGAWFAMHELLGNSKVRMYDGSMHEWTMDNGRAVVTMKME